MADQINIGHFFHLLIYIDLVLLDQGNRTTPSCVAFSHDMQPFKINVDAKNLQVVIRPGSHDKPTNSVTCKNLEIEVSSAILEVSVREKTPSVKAKAKGILEGYLSKMKNALEDETICPKLEPSFKKKIKEAICHLNGWLKYVQNPQANDNEIEKNMKLNKQYYEDIIEKIEQLKKSSSSICSS